MAPSDAKERSASAGHPGDRRCGVYADRMDALAEDAVSFRGGPFSNFAMSAIEVPCPFTGRRRTYATVEHYFQASKATTLQEHAHIAEQPTPREAKRAGRHVKLRADWEEVKFDVMLAALRAKFRIPKYRDRLLATGDSLIAEDSPYDFEWGIRAEDGGYTGQNLLGKALMTVRQELRASDVSGDQLALKVDA